MRSTEHKLTHTHTHTHTHTLLSVQALVCWATQLGLYVQYELWSQPLWTAAIAAEQMALQRKHWALANTLTVLASCQVSSCCWLWRTECFCFYWTECYQELLNWVLQFLCPSGPPELNVSVSLSIRSYWTESFCVSVHQDLLNWEFLFLCPSGPTELRVSVSLSIRTYWTESFCVSVYRELVDWVEELHWRLTTTGDTAADCLAWWCWACLRL